MLKKNKTIWSEMFWEIMIHNGFLRGVKSILLGGKRIELRFWIFGGDRRREFCFSPKESKTNKKTLDPLPLGLVPGPTISGKGSLVHEYATQTGARMLFSNYQTGWIGFN